MKILVVEDDDLMIQLLTQSLSGHHYVVDVVTDGEMGWTYGSTFEYDLMVLDVVLPKLDGISLCRRFRAEGYMTPILLLTAQDTLTAKVHGLDAGADDYVVKPFESAELVARIRALLRRGSTNPSPWLTWGELFLNPNTCEVNYGGQPLTLTAMEYELLELLLRDSQHVFSTEELLERLWSSEEFPSEATVRSHIRHLRQKLAAAGAPRDFIATLHGRGYYLNAPVAPQSSERESPNFSSAGAETDPGTQTQQYYLDFLNKTWTATQPRVLEQIQLLLQVIQDLQLNQLQPQLKEQAHHAAHKLVGTLGIFGLIKISHLARELEHFLGSQELLSPKYAPLLKTLATALQQEVQQTDTIQHTRIALNAPPLLLLVSSEATFNQALSTVAASRGVRLEIAPLPKIAVLQASLAAIAEQCDQTPDVILLRFPVLPAIANDRSATFQAERLQILQAFAQRYPHQPLLLMAECNDLNDHLAMLQQGSKLILPLQTPPEQVMTTVVQCLQMREHPPKVMVIDDDYTWLSTLPTLLKPWGFKVTTLANPEQFWNVLQAVAPDVLVLDIKMPQINGFELCQILRSDPHWQRLPVVFLSSLTDTTSQQQAFTVGADDYLCKPVMGRALAQRILNRLQRIRAYAS
jgi:DNA-binding response OmpR family regulator/HPt (histidine-containing phosphotransfer) domain-containing protein